MVEVYSQPLDKTITVDRIIGRIDGPKPGPTVVFIGGIHGNEPSGVFALQHIFDNIDAKNVCGTIVGISGNLSALASGIRFQQQDLNRLWKKSRLTDIKNGTITTTNEDIDELIAINEILKDIVDNTSGPHYFMDLHTTSSESIPFLTVNDSSLNRDFVKNYPLPIIFGIEEYIDGPILSYINELGYVSFGFEGGQHNSRDAIDNHISFIMVSLVFAGALSIDAANYHHHLEVLAKSTVDTKGFYEVTMRQAISHSDTFKMEPGFVNFQTIKKGAFLATLNGEPQYAKSNSRVFMPLYQDKGEDGYYMIRRIPTIFLSLSRALRSFKFDSILAWLPGIHWANPERDTLLVNLHIARFFAKNFFHLLGYRSFQKDDKYLIIHSREAAARYDEYADAPWRT